VGESGKGVWRGGWGGEVGGGRRGVTKRGSY